MYYILIQLVGSWVIVILFVASQNYLYQREFLMSRKTLHLL